MPAHYYLSEQKVSVSVPLDVTSYFVQVRGTAQPCGNHTLLLMIQESRNSRGRDNLYNFVDSSYNESIFPTAPGDSRNLRDKWQVSVPIGSSRFKYYKVISSKFMELDYRN